MANLSEQDIESALSKYRLSLINKKNNDNAANITTVVNAINDTYNCIDCGDSTTIYENTKIINDLEIIGGLQLNDGN